MNSRFSRTVSAVVVMAGLSFGGFIAIDDGSNPTGEQDFYEIYNDLFGGSYSSSDDLFSDHGVSDDDDNWWTESSTGGNVKVTVRFAGYGQELGVVDKDGNYTTVATAIAGGTTEFVTPVAIDVSGDFAFVEKLSGSGSSVGPWYSDDRGVTNGVDHFVAVDVTGAYNSTYNPSVSRAWMIAFEDLKSGGDHDYNDLVAIVTDVKPVPEAGTISMLGLSLITLMGAAGFRKKQ
ncbi:MAG: DUF4114 domain-containing protein [Chitinivibrionales bacterium]|nr:DUF4114 domain-containing protein [Chitinivibrionales bacterium]